VIEKNIILSNLFFALNATTPVEARTNQAIATQGP
jgi:hypothetical protein